MSSAVMLPLSERQRWDLMPRTVRHRVVRNVAWALTGVGLIIGGPMVLGGWLAFGLTLLGWPLAMNAAVNVAMLRTATGVRHEDQQRAERLLAELCAEMGIKRAPRLTVLNTKKMVNAAALQIIRRDVLVTVPLLHRMTDAQVKGVLAHEFFHLRHHDTHQGLGTYWGVFTGLQAFSVFGAESKLAAVAGGVVAGIVGALLFPLAMTGMLGAVYWRERQADIAAARHTDHGPDLADALRVLSPAGSERPLTRLRRVSARVQAIYSVAPHPPVWDRIERIDAATAKRQSALGKDNAHPAVAPANSRRVTAGAELGL